MLLRFYQASVFWANTRMQVHRKLKYRDIFIEPYSARLNTLRLKIAFARVTET